MVQPSHADSAGERPGGSLLSVSGKGVLSEEERAAYFSNPPPKMSNATIGWIVLGCVVLSLAGVIVDHFVSIPGPTVNMPSVAPPTPGGHSYRPLRPISSTLSAMMGLERERGVAAPSFTLDSQSGTVVALSSFRHKAVLLTFFDSRCDDICPVLARELRVADGLLRARGLLGRVAVVAINTDPLATRPAAAAAAVRAMRGVHHFMFLTGAVPVLDRVWKAYGMTIEAQPATGTLSHSELIYFLSPSGRIAARATPFANEVGRHYVLGQSSVRQFGQGIADEVSRLLGAR